MKSIDPALDEETASVSLKDEQIFNAKYEVYLTVCIYREDEFSFFFMTFEFCKSANRYDIPVLCDKLTYISNSISFLVKWKERADQMVINHLKVK
jgi:hypothetical protein